MMKSNHTHTLLFGNRDRKRHRTNDTGTLKICYFLFSIRIYKPSCHIGHFGSTKRTSSVFRLTHLPPPVRNYSLLLNNNNYGNNSDNSNRHELKYIGYPMIKRHDKELLNRLSKNVKMYYWAPRELNVNY